MTPPVPDIPTLGLVFLPIFLAIVASVIILLITGSMVSDSPTGSRSARQGRAFSKTYFKTLFLGVRHGRH